MQDALGGSRHAPEAIAPRSYQPSRTVRRTDSLKYVNLQVDARIAYGESGLSRLATNGYEDAEGRAEADEEVRSRAGEMIRKLDALDREADAGKAKARECFGKGTHGKRSAEAYAGAKEWIAEERKRVEEVLENALARNKALEKWGAENRTHLVRHVGGMKLEIVSIGMYDAYGFEKSVFTVKATNTTNSRILKPKNHKVWGFETHPDLGGSYPIGAFLTDSFGNDYKLTSIPPSVREAHD